jgi:hypothetical protein
MKSRTASLPSNRFDDSNTFLEETKPGNKLTGTIVFDIPKKTKPSKLLLKSGVWGFSEGVTVYI